MTISKLEDLTLRFQNSQALFGMLWLWLIVHLSIKQQTGLEEVTEH